MKHLIIGIITMLMLLLSAGCKKNTGTTNPNPPVTPGALKLSAYAINGIWESSLDKIQYNVPVNASLALRFNKAVNPANISSSMFLSALSSTLPLTVSVLSQDSSELLLTPSTPLQYLAPYTLAISTEARASDGALIDKRYTVQFSTRMDSSAKFPVVADSVLLDIVQQQTFQYFWDFGHPVSGLARERSNSDNEVVTSGGSGFGIMSIPVAIKRNFISRSAGLARMQTIVFFLKNTAQRFHGAFPHWLNGTSGVVVPFSTKDNGADLVETSFLMAGLLTARQYFDGTTPAEAALRTDITNLYNEVEWDWFRNGGQNVLYWHWSPTYNWEMNLPIQGWNECLVTYIMAASSPTHGIPATVYNNGFARNGNMRNGAAYYGYNLPLGPAYGGPLFLAHYSFLGINPFGLNDQFANYETQVVNHAKINYAYCVANPGNYYGYSNTCWGITASDIAGGYRANAPYDDQGYIAPTAAVASMPYTPAESMAALKFFYYTLGDKLWGTYGFKDAFTLKHPRWFANSYLAIDQGPMIIMIENYRSGLVWNLLTSCPEVKAGMRSLGFSAPYL